MWKRRSFILYHTINVLKTSYINNKVNAGQDAAAVKLIWYAFLNLVPTFMKLRHSQPQ
jgi:hypothetical protein